jgi:four helix bundle protein
MPYDPSPNKNLIVNLTFDFALGIIRYSENLESVRKYIIAKQVLRSGTSIGANVREAQNAESRNDFIHKLKISAKEADESEYWLQLCEASPGYPDSADLLGKIKSIQKVLSKIISTSKRS